MEKYSPSFSVSLPWEHSGLISIFKETKKTMFCISLWESIYIFSNQLGELKLRIWGINIVAFLFPLQSWEFNSWIWMKAKNWQRGEDNSYVTSVKSVDQGGLSSCPAHPWVHRDMTGCFQSSSFLLLDWLSWAWQGRSKHSTARSAWFKMHGG